MLLSDVRDLADVPTTAARILRTFDEPFELDGREIVVTGSVGIAVSTTGYAHAETGLLLDMKR